MRELGERCNVEGEDYLAYQREHEGWYQKLTEIEHKVETGSDVPIPEVQATKPVEEKTMEPDTITIATPKSGLCRVPRKRRKVIMSATINGVKHDVRLSKGVITRSLAHRDAVQNASGIARAAMALQANERELADCMLLLEETAKAAREGSAKFRSSTQSESCTAPDAVHMHETKGEETAAVELLWKTNLTPLPKVAPKTYDAARKGEDSAKWQQAEEKEWNGLWRMGAFEDDGMFGQKLHHLIWLYKVLRR